MHTMPVSWSQGRVCSNSLETSLPNLVFFTTATKVCSVHLQKSSSWLLFTRVTSSKLEVVLVPSIAHHGVANLRHTRLLLQILRPARPRRWCFHLRSSLHGLREPLSPRPQMSQVRSEFGRRSGRGRHL